MASHNVGPSGYNSLNEKIEAANDPIQPAPARLPQHREGEPTASSSASISEKSIPPKEKWSFGILNDPSTEEVPGTVLLLAASRNEPLGMHHQDARHSGSSMPPQDLERRLSTVSTPAKKRTPDGRIILDPQPDQSLNDPLNWPAWRRDAALFSLGFYCMVGGGMTPIVAAGFNNLADTFHVSYSRVALTTGLYMMGLGVGSVIFSPTAILYGKRPVYLASSVMFVAFSIWCAVAPDYGNFAAARVFQGISVSPVECLPSASIAEIFYLHERAFRIGIYTLLLLGGKNLVPLVSAAIIQSKGWRWVFYVVAIVVGFGGIVLFLFVPETFWDRTPRPKSRRPTMRRSISDLVRRQTHRSVDQVRRRKSSVGQQPEEATEADLETVMTPRQQKLHRQNTHAHFEEAPTHSTQDHKVKLKPSGIKLPAPVAYPGPADPAQVDNEAGVPHLHNMNSPWYTQVERSNDYWDHQDESQAESQQKPTSSDGASTPVVEEKHELVSPISHDGEAPIPGIQRYTTTLRYAPPKSYVQTLKPWNGRLSKVSWVKAAIRPFILYAYPAVLWSSLVYSLSIGWLIVLSESVSSVYRNRESYNFSALGVGLVYLSPFIGGVLGTAIAGKVSDVIVQWMARRNGGVYEPEFRLIMAIPVAISTAIGLMGFGWSVQERDAWIVPTIFFGVISFGCSLGSTTAITFCVDSYRQFAGEALVTLNFSKNIFHGLVFSLFFASWLEADGPKDVFLAIGGIQIACLFTTIPMYIYGKRARMWTVRKKMMEKF